MSGNIFDGFEEQTPEEVANQLRIKETSAKEDVLDLVKKSNVLSKEEYENKSKWGLIPDIKNIVAGIRVKATFMSKYENNGISWQEFGPAKIAETSIGEDEIIVYQESTQKTYKYNYSDFINIFEIYMQDQYLTQKIEKVKLVSEIIPGTLIMEDRTVDNMIVTAIEEKTDEETGDTMIVVGLSDDSFFETRKEDFLKDYYMLQVYYPTEEEIESKQIYELTGLTLEDKDNDDLWEIVADINDLKLGARTLKDAIIKREDSIGKVVKIRQDVKRKIWTFKYADGDQKEFDDTYFTPVLKEDLESDKRKGLDSSFIENDAYWTDNWPKKGLKRNVRLKMKSHNNTEYVVLDVNGHILTLETVSTGTIIQIEYSKVMKEFLGYNSDILKLYISINFDEKRLYKDDLWIGIDNISILKEGLILKNYDIIKDVRIPHQVIDIRGNNIELLIDGGKKEVWKFEDLQQKFQAYQGELVPF